jgi:hypothetical protein
VFYFKLYDDIRLKDYKHTKKIEIVNKAVKLYRKDKPLNITNRLLTMLIWCAVPAIVLFLVLNFSLVLVGWRYLHLF